MSNEAFSKVGFFKSYLVPAILIFVIPLISYYFFNYAANDYDADILKSFISSVERDKGISAEDKNAYIDFYQQNSMSSVCVSADPDLKGFAAQYHELCSDYKQFGWMVKLSIWSLVIGVGTFLFSLLCVFTSTLSQSALYRSFRVGWNVLKISSLFQVVSQGMLAVMLSYWITVILSNSYYPKLIALIGFLAFIAIFLIIMAIFKRVDSTSHANGVVIDKAQAPSFYSHINSLCKKIGTQGPDQIIVGIDDNFYVTENNVVVGEQVCEGRTLYVSLSLLKFLDQPEADAILAHEMGHFSGEDTLYTKKLSPLLNRYVEYLNALRDGALSMPVYYFMLFFWSIFQLSLSKISRQREFRADSIAAKTTSPNHFAHALIKVMAYSSYRARIENELFNKNEVKDDLLIGERVSSGFADYVSSSNLHEDMNHSAFPHPFDTHPLTQDRIKHINAVIDKNDYEKMLLSPIRKSWNQAINNANEIEETLWKKYDEYFNAIHEESLAYRYHPNNDTERAIVEKYFPPINVMTKKEDHSLSIDYEKVYYSNWDAPVYFEHIAECKVEKNITRNYLKLIRDKSNTEHSGKTEFWVDNFKENADWVIEVFNRYYSRHQHMKEYQQPEA